MQEFDVIVIGAGPAGGQCARDLSLAGKKTLLIEKAKDFSVNNYSSGGAPLSILKDFNLPESVIGSYWNKLAFLTSHENQLWENSQPLGIVLDFKQLRQFLADEMLKHGGELKLGHLYKSHEKDHDRTIVHVKNQDTQQLDSFTTRVLVDATGVERRVLLKHKKDKTHAALEAPGIEYLVSVDPSIYQKYANTLSFFWGQRWMPQGYAWIFPMQANQLKIGVIRYFSHDRYVPHEESYQFYLEKFMRECLQIDETSILDRHGKTILYTYHQADPKYEENVIAVGDAISDV
jgi:digeranylgeranylglycerophospholipid reductase